MPVLTPRAQSAKFIQSALDDNMYTPDAAQIYSRPWHPLFVYGTLKQSFPRHSLLSGSIYLGSAYTVGTGWVMFRTQNKSSFPVVLEATSQKAGGIAGELYLVKPKMLSNLDFIESNGIMYDRKLRITSLHTPQSGMTACRISSWIYVGTPAHWRHPLTKGDLVECDYLTRKKDPDYNYYTFMLKYVKRYNQSALRNM